MSITPFCKLLALRFLLFIRSPFLALLHVDSRTGRYGKDNITANAAKALKIHRLSVDASSTVLVDRVSTTAVWIGTRFRIFAEKTLNLRRRHNGGIPRYWHMVKSNISDPRNL
jgi:hypothetical protein